MFIKIVISQNDKQTYFDISNWPQFATSSETPLNPKTRFEFLTFHD